jgi:hypothetical protein
MMNKQTFILHNGKRCRIMNRHQAATRAFYPRRQQHQMDATTGEYPRCPLDWSWEFESYTAKNKCPRCQRRVPLLVDKGGRGAWLGCRPCDWAEAMKPVRHVVGYRSHLTRAVLLKAESQRLLKKQKNHGW